MTLAKLAKEMTKIDKSKEQLSIAEARQALSVLSDYVAAEALNVLDVMAVLVSNGYDRKKKKVKKKK